MHKTFERMSRHTNTNMYTHMAVVFTAIQMITFFVETNILEFPVDRYLGSASPGLSGRCLIPGQVCGCPERHAALQCCRRLATPRRDAAVGSLAWW